MSMIDQLANVASDAIVGEGTSIWGLTQIRERAVIGAECVIGRGAYVGPGVRVGDRTKVQNLAQIYEPAVIESGAFIGPGVILTNDQYPRAVRPSGKIATTDDWQRVGVTVREGASLGARSVCVAPVEIGRWAMVAAGSTVILDVPDFALVAGTPARFIGWVGRSGRRLYLKESGLWQCPVSAEIYREKGECLTEVHS